MADLRGQAKAHPFWGWLCVAAGLIPVLIALGVIKPDPSDVHAPMWVVGIGVVMSFAISIFAFRQFYNPSPGRS